MPNGIIRAVTDALRETLADCYQWQHWQGNTFTRSEALARIYVNALPKPADGKAAHSLDDLNTLRPFILIWRDPDSGFVMNRDAVAGGYNQAGKMTICIEQDIPTALLDDPSGIDDALDADLELLLRSGDYNQPGLAELADTAGNFIVRRAEVVGPVRVEEEDIQTLGESQRVWVNLQWGFGY